MKKILSVVFLLIIVASCSFIYSANLENGSYETNWTFVDGNYARGVAVVDGAVTLPQSGNVYVNISTGGFRNVNANDSTITLSNNLEIYGTINTVEDSNSYLKFLGNNNTLLLSANQTFSCLKSTVKNLIIDCADNNLTLSGSKTLRVAMGSNLHLKNCTINIYNSDAIFLESELSKLILENCTLDLYSSFSIDKGSLEFRGDNLIQTNNSKVFFLGGGNHEIKSNCTLTLNNGVSFNMTPSTSTGQFFVFEDSTSQLILDGTTLTIDESVKGILHGGNVVMQNGCRTNTVKKTILQEVRNPSLDFGNLMNIRASNWSPCGKYLAVVGDDGVADPDGTGYTGIYYYNDGALSLVTSVEHANKDYWYTVVWSPDGNYVAAGGGDVSGYDKVLVIYAFNGSSLIEVAHVDWSGDSCFVYDVSWHPGGDYIVAGGKNYGAAGEDGFVVYAFDGSCLTQKGAKSGTYVSSLAWDPLGEYIAIGSATDPVELEIYEFDVSTETLNTTAIVTVDLAPDMNIVRWRYDGAYLGIGDTSGNIYIYSFNRGIPSLTQEFTKEVGTRIDGLAWSPDGNYVAFTECANYLEVDRFYIDDAGEGSLSYIYGATFNDTVDVNTVAWHPGGNPIAVGAGIGGVGAELKLFNFRGITFEEITESQVEFGDHGEACDWSFDGNYLAIVGSNPTNEKEVQVYKFDGENLTYATGVDYLGGDVRSVSWSPNGQYLAFGGGGNMKTAVYSFNSNTEELNFTYSRIYDDHDFADGFSVYGIDWSSSGNYLAACGWVDSDHCDNICVYKFENDELNTLTYAPFPAPDLGYTSTYVRSVRWSPSENYLAAGGQTKGKIAVYSFDSTATSLLLQDSVSLSQDDYAVFSIDWFPNGEYLATAGNNSLYVYSWNGTSLTEKYRDDNLTTYAYDLKWSNNGSYLAVGGQNLSSGGEDFKIYEFDGDEESLSELSQTKIYSPEIIYGVAWRPDDKALAIVGQGNPDIKVYDFDGSMLTFINGTKLIFDDGDTFFDVSPDGNYIAVVGYNFQGGGNKELQLFDATSNELTCLYNLTVDYFARSVDWSVDGKYVVEADTNNTLHIYELSNETFQEIGSGTLVDTTFLHTAKWSPCGRYIAVGERNGHPAKYNITIYEFDGTNLTIACGIDLGSDYTTELYDLDWSANGIYIAVGGKRINVNPATYPYDHEIRVYEFDPTVPSLTYKDGDSCIDDGVIYVHWNSDGEYLGATGSDGITYLYNFDGTTLSLTTSFDVGDTGCEIRWDPKGKYLVICQRGGSNNSGEINFYEFDRNTAELNLLSNLGMTSDAEDDATVRWYPRSDKFAVLGKSILKVYNWNGLPLQQASEMSIDYGAQTWGTKWHPSGNYLAVAGKNPTDTVNEFKVFEFDKNKTLTLLPGTKIDYCSADTSVFDIDWSPDGTYLAVGGSNPNNGKELQVYCFNKRVSLALTTSMDYGDSIYSVAWSPDSNYLAVGGEQATDNNELKIYMLNDKKYLVEVVGCDYSSGNTAIRAVDWSPNGQYVAVAGCEYDDLDGQFRIYEFNSTASTLSYVDGKRYTESGLNDQYSVAWSPSGIYVAVGGKPNSNLRIYSFNGSSLSSEIINESLGTDSINSIVWSPCGNYFAVGVSSPTNENEIQIYYFSGSALTLIADLNYGSSGSYILDIDWSLGGQYLVAGGYSPEDGKEIKVYPIDWVYNEEPVTSETVSDIEMFDSIIDVSKALTINNMRLRVR
jgi:WD40 repeat protein